MAIFITGDTHGDFIRFKKEVFYEQAELTKEGQLGQCGLGGGLHHHPLLPHLGARRVE